MMALLNWRLWALLAMAGVLAFTHVKAFKGGKAAVQVQWDAAKIAANEATRQREKSLTIANTKVDYELQADKKRRAVADRATADSLRDFKTALAAKPNDPVTPGGINGTGGLERELLGQCATHLAQLAITADKLEAKVVGLQGYVQNVCLKQ